MGNDCEKVVHSCCTQLGLQPTAGQRPPGQGPSGHVKVGVTSYGVCGHLLDSLSAWDHSDTLLKPEQAHFGRFYGIMFFRKDSPQTGKEGVTRITRSQNQKTWPIRSPTPWKARRPVRHRYARRRGSSSRGCKHDRATIDEKYKENRTTHRTPRLKRARLNRQRVIRHTFQRRGLDQQILRPARASSQKAPS